MLISYPPDLPISDRREELLELIRDHQVVIVAGETGSGKSTQLPKMCMELGRGQDAFIGHTQPRRLAARSVAERIAEELDSKLGGVVGYAVRFTDEVGPTTRLKLMTDGILLAEIQRDRMLRRYDTIIIDEAHERSLNIDFLLGYLKQLLPRRPDLKIIITSATIDTERFSTHFDDAPILEVSGRTYPVDMRWAPLTDGESQVDGIAQAVSELTREGPGDILVFLSGEADIRDAEEGLKQLRLPNTEIFPLYARLSAAEQHRVFESHHGRRVILATNVAETSLTVPGIRYVVDPGNARISRYSFRTKVQRLPIESVSQASADQRAGRCGRVGPGICIRLYDEEDFAARELFTEPEIQRTNLASVILQMANLGLGEVESFPFVDPPDDRSIRDGIALLEELGALDSAQRGTKGWLTSQGKQLAALPVDPRLARMVIEADRNACLDEVLIIVSGLSVIDPRERPRGNRSAAEESHEAFVNENSDFLSWLELWAVLGNEERNRTGNQFRKWCKQNHLHYMRIREWRDIHRQLRRVVRNLGFRGGDPTALPEQIHRSLLAGLLSQIGMKDPVKDEFRGARGTRFAIARGSTLYRRSPDWVMAAEMVETNRLWARTVTRIDPEWAEDLASHLVERSYGDPWWAPDRGSAYVDERVTLYGLPLVTGRPASLSQLDKRAAREMFIHHGLIEGDWEAHFGFMDHNESVLRSINADEARQRRDLLIDYDALFAFYDDQVGIDVISGRSFENWWKKQRKTDASVLNLDRDVILASDATDIDTDAFPDRWEFGGLDLSLDYEFDPESETDGVTVNVPVSALNQIDATAFEWNVPGLRGDLVTSLIRSLPKEWRKLFVPVPETVADVLPKLDPKDGDLVESLRRELSRLSGRTLPFDLLALDQIEERLRPTFRVIGDGGAVLAESKRLDELDEALAAHVRSAIAQADRSVEVTGMTAWTCGELPPIVEAAGGGHVVKAFPSLVDHGTTVSVELLPSAEEQEGAMRKGLRRLVALNTPGPTRLVDRLLSGPAALVLASSPYDTPRSFIADCHNAVLNSLIDEAGGETVRDAEGFEMIVHAVNRRLDTVLKEVTSAALALLATASNIQQAVNAMTTAEMAPSRTDMADHLDRLVYPGFLTRVGIARLNDMGRYLTALEIRARKIAGRITPDLEGVRRCQAIETDVYQLVRHLPGSPDLTALLWSLEELRVSVFAQQVGTNGPVSEKRIRKAMTALTAV